MGNGNSKANTTTAVLNNAIINAVSSSITSCGQSGSQSQEIVIEGEVNGDVKQEQTMVMNMSCVQSTMQSTETLAKMANSVAEEIKAKNEGSLAFLDKGTDAEALAWITNIINVNITSQSQQVMTQQFQQSQKLSVKQGATVNGDITQTQSARAIAEQIASTEQVQRAIGEIANDVDQKSTTQSKGIISSIVDSVAAAVGSVALAVPLIIGGIILAIIIIIGMPVYFLSRRKTGGRDIEGLGELNSIVRGSLLDLEL